MVERDLAKVEVAGSSPVFRSEIQSRPWKPGRDFFSQGSPGGGIGRHAGLKILFAATRVRVQFPPGAHRKKEIVNDLFFYAIN